MIFLEKSLWEIKKTKNKGKGVFAKKDITKGIIIGDYIGKVLHPEDIDLEKMEAYLMYYTDDACIYPNLKTPGMHLLNHACFPNCFLYIYKGHTLAFTLKKILKGEELTISYLLPPRSKLEKKCSHKCMCGSKNCTKSMHLPVGIYKKWRKFQEPIRQAQGKQSKVTYGENLKLLPKYPKTVKDNPIYNLFKTSAEGFSFRIHSTKIFPLIVSA